MQQKKAGVIPREDQYVKQAAECRYSSKKVRKIMNKGKIIQVMGPVVDVVFQDGNLPFIKMTLWKLKITERNVLWKWRSISETMKFAV